MELRLWRWCGNKGNTRALPSPDLAVLDLNVPKYDGVEILEAMRANPAFAERARGRPELFVLAPRAGEYRKVSYQPLHHQAARPG